MDQLYFEPRSDGIFHSFSNQKRKKEKIVKCAFFHSYWIEEILKADLMFFLIFIAINCIESQIILHYLAANFIKERNSKSTNAPLNFRMIIHIIHIYADNCNCYIIEQQCLGFVSKVTQSWGATLTVAYFVVRL